MADVPDATEEQDPVEAAAADADVEGDTDAQPDDAQPDDAQPDDAQPEVPEVEVLHGVPVTYSHGQTVLHPSKDEYVDLVTDLRRQGYWLCADLCGVDYLTYDAADRGLPVSVAPERFEVVVVLLNNEDRTRIRLRVQISGEEPALATITPVHPSAENPEREVYDLFGIYFTGHPDMSRILMPDDWDGHPLRKDYSVGEIPVQFKEAPTAR